MSRPGQEKQPSYWVHPVKTNFGAAIARRLAAAGANVVVSGSPT